MRDKQWLLENIIFFCAGLLLGGLIIALLGW